MRKPVIELQNVTKSFLSWEDRPDSIKRILIDLVRGNFSSGKRNKIEVLKNISFTIHEGEFVGIMGPNGAGKSTILKLIAGIYSPTSGSVKVYGKVAPLLELGAGFAEDLTGLENIYLNASILGYSNKATKAHLNSIIEFSELGSAIYKPVKKYSSGMLMRLGFSVAAHLDAPILLFDEVLAVGDVGFQEKCLNKINELHKQGRAIILITHSPDAVTQHCDRCIVINNQKVAFDGNASDGAEFYRTLFHLPVRLKV